MGSRLGQGVGEVKNINFVSDIDGTLNSIRPVGQSASSDREEGVDFASDGELYLDSVDNFEMSSSDPEDRSAARNQYK